MTYLSELHGGTLQKKEMRNVTFEEKYDVIVCGLGTAGSFAALFSAENGLNVLGIEAFTCVGGTHTAGGISGHYFGSPGGRYEAVDEKALAFAREYTCTPTEGRKLIYEEALAESGVTILYESSVCGVFSEDQTVIGLRVLSEGRMIDVGAKIVMDCTAEGTVAAMAGCKTEAGRALDGQMQPYSLVSLWCDGDKYRFNNVDFGRVDQNDPKSLSEAILFARACDLDEAKKGTLVSQMPFLGIREGRRIVAEEGVLLGEVFKGKQTDTPMFYSYADLDKHGWDVAFDGETLGDWAIGANLGAYNVTVAVPYKAILPKDYDGILVPCRALGVDRDISSLVRMNLDMKKAAEAAAVWASLSVEQNVPLRQVPYSHLKKELIKSGCLKESDNRGYRVDGKRNWDGTALIKRDVRWITDPKFLKSALQTDTPGEGIWSAKQMGENAVPTLLELAASENESLKKHASFALAALGRSDAVDTLRAMVIERDGFMLKDCRKHNQLRGCMAIYWLGRLADRNIAEELIRLVCDPEEIKKAVYHQKGVQTTRYQVSGFEDIYYQFASQAVMALIRIGDAHKDLRTRIGKAFSDVFSSDNYDSRITDRPRESSEGNMVLTMKENAFSALKQWNL